MAFFAPMSEEHGRISAVTATRILQRMVNGDVGDVDERRIFASAHGTAQLRPKKRRGRTRMKAKKRGVNQKICGYRIHGKNHY